MTEIVVSIITGILTLVGVIVSNIGTNRKMENQLELHQAVTETKLGNLTEEVRKHNNFASRVPIIERDIEYLKHEVDDIKGGKS